MKYIYILSSLLGLFIIQGCYLNSVVEIDTKETKEMVENLYGTWKITSMKITGKSPSSSQLVTYTNQDAGTVAINRIKDPYGNDYTNFSFIFSAYNKLKVPQLGTSVTYGTTNRLIDINYISKGVYQSRSYAVPYDENTFSYECSSRYTILSSGGIQITWKNIDTDENGIMILDKQ